MALKVILSHGWSLITTTMNTSEVVISCVFESLVIYGFFRGNNFLICLPFKHVVKTFNLTIASMNTMYVRARDIQYRENGKERELSFLKA